LTCVSLVSSIILSPPHRFPFFPYTTLFRSIKDVQFAILCFPIVPRCAAASAALVVVAGACQHFAEFLNGGGLKPIKHFDLGDSRSEEHTSELQSLTNLVCRLMLGKKTPRTT